MTSFRSNAIELLQAAAAKWTLLHTIIFISSVVLLHLGSNKYFSRLRHVPGPFMAGCTRLWKLKVVRQGQMEKVQMKLHAQYGPIVRIAPNEVIISEPSAIKTIYGHTSKIGKTKFYVPFGTKDNDDLFSDPNVQRHAHNRREIAAAYSMTSLVELEPFVDRCTKVMCEKIDELFVSGRKPLDLASWLQFYAFDIKDRLERGDQGHIDFVSRLQKMGRNEATIWRSCFANVAAGSDTTGISLRSILYFLLKNPRAYQRLQQEIDTMSNDGKISNPVTFNEAINMPYLQAQLGDERSNETTSGGSVESTSVRATIKPPNWFGHYLEWI
ncbi:hypothetical protein QQX98_000895 [Neonectria punicea]|uniref:Cytochrome P450 n=1 Tax=Neonectria punicea TaxID=979145 RepID=A0ABR1HR47_9HYPO